MEGDVGTQVAPPPPVYYRHQYTDAATVAAKKRGLPCPVSVAPVGTGTPAANWNPQRWSWDSSRFAARPAVELSNSSRFTSPHLHTVAPDARNRGAGTSIAPTLQGAGDSDESLNLNLGGGLYSSPTVESAVVVAATTAETPVAAPHQPVTRPNKRVRSGSPGSGGGGGGGGNYPMCQVDDCRADLTNNKDYHRRHKVCGVHSKATTALVGNQMQRFCQQCSRFHLLSEFDEGKRSCRRRLAGHNRRRRKTQQNDTVASQLLMSANQETAANAGLNIINLLTILTQLQGGNVSKPAAGTNPPPDKDGIARIVNGITSLNARSLSTRSPASGSLNLNDSQLPQESFEHSHSTRNLLGAITMVPPLTVATHLPSSSGSSGNDKVNTNHREPATCANSPPVILDDKTQSHVADKPSLSLQLFGGSTEDESPPKLDSMVKYLSSESSNPLDDRSLSSSPPITHKFFPMRSEMEEVNNAAVEASTTHALCGPLELFGNSDGAPQNAPYTACYASSSGSDHLQSLSNSDAQDRTGRIIFKLFGKEPGDFPSNLRDDILNWLSNSPSEMESYIRPGCVILTIYALMSSKSWDELEGNLLQRVTFLVRRSRSEFWKNGRFLVRTDRQLVSHRDGTVRLSRSWKTWSSPELTSVSPVAVVSGMQTSLVLKGRNLTVPGTKIHCTHMGKYVSKEVLCSVYPGTIYDASSVESFDFPEEHPSTLGRCFIEVENGFKGNSFPVIVASSSICHELRTLEPEFEDRTHDGEPLKSRADVVHFLNELGWLFQRAAGTGNPSEPYLHDFSIIRFKHLLTFAVDRDWCAVSKTLLEFLTTKSFSGSTATSVEESRQMLSEIHLLNRAVHRKCKKMIDLLLRFSITLPHGLQAYPFPPNSIGPRGLTSLHIAACSSDADEIVDALTNDPQQIGTSCWNTVEDDSGQTPRAYVTQQNNQRYNTLVDRKAADRQNGHVSIPVGSMDISLDVSGAAPGPQAGKHCAACSILMGARRCGPRRSTGVLRRPFALSMLGVAAVCVCVCVIMRVLLRINSGASFKWEAIDYGAI